jgi:hypothetical protein
MSVARLWRDQGKVQQARELLAPGLKTPPRRSLTMLVMMNDP